MSFSGSESCPLWFFTFHPLGSRCGPQPCVYAVRGDAWRQTSTPHPNNGLLLCSPLLGRLIIRIVSQGEWGCNVQTALRPQSNLSCSHSPLTLASCCFSCAPPPSFTIWWLYLSVVERVMKIPLKLCLKQCDAERLFFFHVGCKRRKNYELPSM